MSEAPWHFYVMAAMYVFAGIMHFVYPEPYVRIMPKFLPAPKKLVYLSGIAEVVLGIGLCIGNLQHIALFGIILLLLVFLVVHFNMLIDKSTAAGLPFWILILRIPLQFGLIYWAYWYL
ncbi:MAG: DoxX family protein [Flavobacteriaceae bacterium]|nr:DoxX family protein [Flavobacteriaceae bacterium]